MDFTLNSDYRPESELEFFSLKLTDDLLRKITKGQSDWSNLNGVSVTLSPSGSNVSFGDYIHVQFILNAFAIPFRLFKSETKRFNSLA